MAGPENGGAATIKDVWAAVDNVRTELGGKIDQLRETVNIVVASHEHRLTINETTQATHSERLTSLETNQSKHSNEIAAINEKLRETEGAREARQVAKAKRTSTRRWITGTVLTVLGLILAGALLLVTG